MMPRLVPWPRAAAAVIAVCVVVVGVLGALVHDDTRGTGFDDAILRWIDAHLSASVLDAMLHLTDPPLVIGLLVAVALVGAVLRRWAVTALAVATPVIAVLLTEEVLKPLVHRTNGVVTGFGEQSYAYPSGHETVFGSLVAVLGLLLARSEVRRAGKVAGLVVLAALLVVAAVSLVGRFYHFATDTIGAVGVAVACVLGVGLAIDAIGAALVARRQERLAQGTPRS